MKTVFRRIAYWSLGCALVASPWIVPAVAQDLRLKNQPTLAQPRSSFELRTGPTLSAQKQTGTTTAPTTIAPTAAPTTAASTGSATSNYATPPSTSRWAPVAAATSLPASTTAGVPVAPAVADPVSTPTPTPAGEQPVRLSVGTLSPTPEMWFYEQMRQDANNPETIIRRRAEQAAAERKARIAARAWYGVSLARPQAHVTPMTYYYSPTWTQNSKYPYSWAAPRAATPVIIEARRPYAGLSNFGAW